MSFGIELIVSRPRSLSLKRISVEQVRHARSYLLRDQTNMSNNSMESLMIMTGTILLSLVVYLLMTCCYAEDEWKSHLSVCSWQQSSQSTTVQTDRQTSAYVWRTWQSRVNHSSTDSNRFFISTGKLSRHTHTCPCLQIVPSACPHVQCSRLRFLHWYQAAMMIEWLLIWHASRIPIFSQFIDSRQEEDSVIHCHYFVQQPLIIHCYTDRKRHPEVFRILPSLSLSLPFAVEFFSLFLSLFFSRSTLLRWYPANERKRRTREKDSVVYESNMMKV